MDELGSSAALTTQSARGADLGPHVTEGQAVVSAADGAMGAISDGNVSWLSKGPWHNDGDAGDTNAEAAGRRAPGKVDPRRPHPHITAPRSMVQATLRLRVLDFAAHHCTCCGVEG